MNCQICHAPIGVNTRICAECEKSLRHKTDQLLFWKAVVDGDVEVVNTYMDAGNNINEPYTEGTTILMHAVVNRASDQIIELLLSRGANPRIASSDSTPLHFAKTVKTAKLLLEHGADIHARDKHGWQPIHSAVDNPLLLEFLIDNGADPAAMNYHGMDVVSQAKNKRSLQILNQYVDVRQSSGCSTVLIVIAFVILWLIGIWN